LSESRVITSIPHHPVKQFWSWSGLTDEDREELNRHI